MNTTEGKEQQAADVSASGSKGLLCDICGAHYSWAWTDTHGIAQCWTCGTPYTLYHYDEHKQRLDKPPEMAIKPEYVPVLQAYWRETRRKIPGGCSFPGGQELATREDSEKFSAWLDANEEKYLPHNDALKLRECSERQT